MFNNNSWVHEDASQSQQTKLQVPDNGFYIGLYETSQHAPFDSGEAQLIKAASTAQKQHVGFIPLFVGDHSKGRLRLPATVQNRLLMRLCVHDSRHLSVFRAPLQLPSVSALQLPAGQSRLENPLLSSLTEFSFRSNTKLFHCLNEFVPKSGRFYTLRTTQYCSQRTLGDK